jgi:hypothetical protein
VFAALCWAETEVHDYALDVKNFHKGSHKLPIVPVVLATEAAISGLPEVRFAPDGIAEPVLARGVGNG